MLYLDNMTKLFTLLGIIIAAIGWFIRLEFTGKQNAKDITRLEGELEKHKSDSSEEFKKISGKLDDVKSDIGKLSIILAKIEVTLEHTVSKNE